MAGVLALVALETGAPALGAARLGRWSVRPWRCCPGCTRASRCWPAGSGWRLSCACVRRADASPGAGAPSPPYRWSRRRGGSATSGGSTARPTRRRPTAPGPKAASGSFPPASPACSRDQQFGLVATAPVLLAGAGRPGAAGPAAAAPGDRARRDRPAVPARRLDLPDVVGRLQRAGPLRGRGPAAAAALPLAACGPRAGSAAASSCALTVVSAAITAALVAHDRGAFIYNGRDGHALLLDWLSPTVDLTLGTPSVHRDGAAGGGRRRRHLARCRRRRRGPLGAAGAGAGPHGVRPRWPACWRCRWRP